MKLILSLYMLSALSLTIFGQGPKCQSHLTHDNKHTFTLTTLATEVENIGHDVMYKQAAEACYQNCNSAELMSLSKDYWKNRTPITLLDRATIFLMESGFFQANQTYLVNQIVVAEEEPAGLGCLLMESSANFSLHSLNDSACNSTKSVVCGMPGTQSISNTRLDEMQQSNTTNTDNADKGGEIVKEPVINISSGMAEAITRATSNDGKGSINGTTVNSQLTPSNSGHEHEGNVQDIKNLPDQKGQIDNDNEVLTSPANSTEPMNDDGTSVDANEPNASDAPVGDYATTIPTPEEDDLVYPLNIGNINYKVVRLQRSHTTTESAATMCQKHQDKIGSLYSSSIPDFSSWFQRVHPKGKTIIGSWNGDRYGANGSQCLVYSTAQGVHLGTCTDASVLLCESTLQANQ